MTGPSLSALCQHLMSSLEPLDLQGACAAVSPWAARAPGAAPVYTACHLEGAPPVLNARYSQPLDGEGIQLFSTEDPPEVACDVSLLAHAPPSLEGFLMTDGRLLELRWTFSSRAGLLGVECRAEVSPLDVPAVQLGRHAASTVKAVLNLALQAALADVDGAAFFRTDPHALGFLVACERHGASPAVAVGHVLAHQGRDETATLHLVALLCGLPGPDLKGLLPAVEAAGLRPAVEEELLRRLAEPRSWLETPLLERVAFLTSPEMDRRVFACMEHRAFPWIAWWQMAAALEACGSLQSAVRLATRALHKLPSSMDAIRLLERCGGEAAIEAVAWAVAWMEEERYHRLPAAREILIRMCGEADAARRVAEATRLLHGSTRLSRRIMDVR